MKVEQLLNEPRFVAWRDKLRLDDRKLSLIIVLLLTFVVYLDVRILMRGQLESLRRLEPEKVRLKTEFEFLNKNLAIMQTLKTKPGGSQEPFRAKAKKLINEEEIHVLYQDISVLAKKNDVKIVLMKPTRESPGSKAQKAHPSEKFTPLLLSLDLICDYRHLTAFIHDLENAEALLIVHKIRVSPQENSLQQKVDLVLQTYLGK
ncbi:MAG: type 4a pilus biogenesis protein PilO [Candidatus Omnitrophota bacterium]